MNPTVAIKTNSIARTFRTITASKNEELPTRIEILRAGSWPANSNKGQLEITEADLQEMARNFKAGVGLPGQGQTGLPIDFMHEDWGPAAGWITDVEVEGGVLFALVEWSKAGQEAVINKEFKCVSPSFYPGCLGMWTDPEDASITARNVLVGAGLTNIPFFKDLKPILASRDSESEDRNVIYINASETKEIQMLTLDAVRGKELADLNEEEKTFLTENKDALNADEKKKFGFEEEKPKVDANKDDKKEEPKVDADAKVEGMVQVKASVLASLEATAAEYRKDKESQYVDSLIARGAVKADQKESIVNQLVTADDSLRATLKQTFDNLPNHPVMEDAKGKDGGEEVSATDQIRKLATEKVEAARKSGKTLEVSDAYAQIMSEKPELAKQYNEERGVK